MNDLIYFVRFSIASRLQFQIGMGFVERTQNFNEIFLLKVRPVWIKRAELMFPVGLALQTSFITYKNSCIRFL